MMRPMGLLTAAAATLLPVVGGCKKPADSPAASTPAALGAPKTGAEPVAAKVAAPGGWKVYSPPEADFSVQVPADPSLVRPIKEKEQSLRLYVFKKGEAAFNVMVFERTGAAMQRDRPEEIKADPQVAAGSVKEVSLAGMAGLEFRRDDPEEGECIHRAFRSPDGSRAVSLRVVKPGSLSDAEVKRFLDSFKILR